MAVCVARDDNYLLPFAFSLIPIRASAVVAAAVSRAIRLWNAGLNNVQFEFVDNCNQATFRTLTVNRPKAAGSGTLATAPFPNRGEGVGREIYVWDQALINNYQNVLTSIMSHELGHTIGLAHENCQTLNPTQPCEPITNTVLNSVMESGISNSDIETFNGPTSADISGANAFYALAAGPRSEKKIILWTATRGALITYPRLPRCRWYLGICFY